MPFLERKLLYFDFNFIEVSAQGSKQQLVSMALGGRGDKPFPELMYRQVSNIRRTLVINKIVDHSDVVGAWPVGAAPTTSSFST